jgi:murein DD-endopeptidase MepM/ murein hydrolase activator NlpD
MKADLTDLQAKLKEAHSDLDTLDPKDPRYKERKAELKADIRQLKEQIAEASKTLDEQVAKERTVSVTVKWKTTYAGGWNEYARDHGIPTGGMFVDGPSEPNEGRIGSGLMAATAGAGALGTGFGAWGPRWSWNRNPRTGMGQHDGADISARSGTPVYATHPGTVTGTGTDGWAGNHVVWESNGVRYIYAHLSSIARYSGAVSKGTMLGRVGETGNATGPHLHVQASRNGSYVNPAHYLAEGGIVKRRPGGTVAVIGEGRYDEAVVPLKNGAAAMGGILEVHFHNPVIGSREDLARYITEAQLDYKRRRGTELGIA